MKKILYILLAACLMVACKPEANTPDSTTQPPVIQTFAPTEGGVGTEICIEGENLTRIDSVWIGETPTRIKYRVSQRKLMIEVVSGVKSGAITVSNPVGRYTTKDIFTVQYKQPTVDEYPTEVTVYDQVVLTGKNLQFVSAVLIDGEPVSIIAQREEELVFEVPFHDDETPVTLRLSYFDGTQEKQFGPEGATLTIVKLKPIITTCPTGLTKYEPVRIEGERLNLIDALYIGELKADIRLQNETMIEFDVPGNYFDGPFTADLKAIYYGTKEMVLCPNFSVVSDPNEPRYNVYKNLVLSARAGSGGTETCFLDGDEGIVYASCEVEENMQSIDFFLYDNSGYAQLYSPNNATNTLKNYKCEGTSITAANPTAWNEFYQVECLFRVLDPANDAQKAIIDAYEAGTIIKLDEDFFAGVTPPSSKAPRVYQTDEDRNKGGNGHFSAESYAWGWVKNYATGKNGIIKVLSTKANAENGKTYEITIDLIWEK